MRTRRGKRGGFGLVEAMVAIFILSLLSLSLALTYKYLSVVLFRTLSNSYATRLSEAAFSKLKTIDYYYVFDCDSSLPNFGLNGTFGPVTLQRPVYPYLGVLRALDGLTRKYGIDRWTISISYKMRDVSDVNGNGMTGDLRDFIDANGNLADDYDQAVRYYKANADADYYDTYVSTTLNKTVSEVPDTNLKEATLRLYRRGKIIHTQQELISLEMFSGMESRASGAELKLFVSQPSNNTYLYDLMSPARAGAFALAISKPYPADVLALRADPVSPLVLKGETAPLASLKVYRNSIGAVLDTGTSYPSGDFDFWATGLTSALTEGENTVYAQAVKDTFFSPYASRNVLLDLKPPEITGQVPTGAVHDLMPYVGACLTDTVLSTGAPSGICGEVTNMTVDGSTVPFVYDPSGGQIQWVDPATEMPVKLENGSSHTVAVEGGDRAYYKTAAAWTFSVSVPLTDHSAPAVAEKVPIGASAGTLPEIGCRVIDNQSGIDPYSIVLRLDGAVIVSSANIAGAWDAASQRVSYMPPSPFAAGSAHTVSVAVSHWADDPPEKKTHIETWDFTVAY